MRDLFEADDGGWLQDPAILDRLVMEKLQEAAEQVRAEGWKWVETALAFPWGHTRQFAEIDGTEMPLSDEETARLEALHTEQEAIEAEYASDRDVFLFLVDDTHPIEAGCLPNGDPDLYFRGFYAWNSEVGSKSLGIASFYLRGVCQNRMLWGVENFEQITIRHSKFAASRFVHQATPALRNFATASPASFVSGIQASRQALVAKTDEDRESFLRRRGVRHPVAGWIGGLEFRAEAWAWDLMSAARLKVFG
ncbi:hypothetical protein GLUCORHAEAF1_07700 [Komagataeibacter rhaeticus AF1]|nr:hypothetical protein GLUCORHAEAF1_07700 [Komagataeibacter rhaeticus AF1]